MTFSGLMVFDVTTASGFAEHGRVAHPHAERLATTARLLELVDQRQLRGEARASCIDDFVLSISNEVMKVSNLAQLATPVASVPLGP